MSTFSLSLNQGDVGTVPSGASFQILTSNRDVDLQFILGGQVKNRATKVPASYYYRPDVSVLNGAGLAFDQVRVTATYGKVDLLVDVSSADSGTNVLAGAVQVTNFDMSMTERTQAGGEFVIGNGLTGIAGSYAHTQIYNPQNSGVDVYIKKCMVSTLEASGTARYAGRVTAALSDLGGAAENKLSTGPVSKIQVRQQQSPSILLTARMFRFAVNINSPVSFIEGSPIHLAEGEGFAVMADPGQSIYSNFEWEEVAKS